jgi:drug/metabolite transporter (DMT)-like permease
MLLWLSVLIRIVANPLSNVFQKLLSHRGASPLFILFWVYAVLSGVSVPLFIARGTALSFEFGWAITLSSILAVTGNALLIAALRRSDLSILGPINAFKPVVSLVPGMIFLNEMPSPVGMAGILVVVVGSLLLSDPDSRGASGGLLGDRGVQLRLAALVLSALEAVFLKRALLAADVPATFGGWSILGFGLTLFGVLAGAGGSRAGRDGRVVKAAWPTAFALALSTGAMQASTLLAFQGLKVGYALALFQISPILSVLLGHRVFGEPHLLRRLLGSGVMAAGAALIVAGR